MSEGSGSGSVRRYRFGPLERRGLLAGWRGGQAAAVGAGLVVAVAALRALPIAAALAVAVVAVGTSLAVATWPVAGRTGDQWLPDVVRHGARLALGRRWREGPATSSAGQGKGRSGAGLRVHTSGMTGDRKGRSAVLGGIKGPFSALRILQVDASGEDAVVRVTERGSSRRTGHSLAAVVHDPVEGTYTAVMPASCPGFVLLGTSDRDRRVAGWAAALGTLARQGTPVHRVQWVARTLPGGSRSPRSETPGLPPPGPASQAGSTGAAAMSYEELFDAVHPSMRRHQVLLAVSVRGARHGLALRPAGAAENATACAVLMREVADLRRRLSDADVDTAPALAPRSLAAVLRAGFSSSRWSWPEECGTTWPWPVAGEVHWDAVRIDGTWHATYWVAEWPRTDVGADFLGPLLLAGEVRQSVAVTMEPLSPLEAARRTQQARTADVADAELRRKGGFLHTARRRREEETLADRELELADGHAPFRFSGYVTVSSDVREQLECSCGRVEQAAGQAGMELRRCYGDQQRAFCFTMPLCRGLQ